MDRKNKYRVRAVPSWALIFTETKPTIKYTIQKKIWGLFWLSITDDWPDKQYVQELCDEFNAINK